MDKYISSVLINLLLDCNAKFRRQPAAEFWLHAQDSKIFWALIELLEKQKEKMKNRDSFTLTALLNTVIFSFLSSYLRRSSLQNID